MSELVSIGDIGCLRPAAITDNLVPATFRPPVDIQAQTLRPRSGPRDRLIDHRYRPSCPLSHAVQLGEKS